MDLGLFATIFNAWWDGMVRYAILMSMANGCYLPDNKDTPDTP